MCRCYPHLISILPIPCLAASANTAMIRSAVLSVLSSWSPACAIVTILDGGFETTGGFLPQRPLPPELSPKLEDIINKALEKDRRLRYQHASELYADLQRLKRDISSGGSTEAGQGGEVGDNCE